MQVCIVKSIECAGIFFQGRGREEELKMGFRLSSRSGFIILTAQGQGWFLLVRSKGLNDTEAFKNSRTLKTCPGNCGEFGGHMDRFDWRIRSLKLITGKETFP
jgi:hypothetical protein